MNKLLNLSTIKIILESRTASSRAGVINKLTSSVNVDKPSIPSRITLIGPDNSVSITDFKQAQSLSLRRELKLVKIQDVDSKTRRPVYKLMTNIEYQEGELQRRKDKQEARQNNASKGDKLISISPKIGEHDLMTRVKKMLKLLEKQYEVRVVISGDEGEMQKAEKIYTIIESNLSSTGKIVQKRTKGNSLRFQLLPNKEKTQQASDSHSQPTDDQHSNSPPTDAKSPL